MADFISGVGAIGFFVFLILLVIAAIKGRPLRRGIIAACICLVLWILGGLIINDYENYDDTTLSRTTKTVVTSTPRPAKTARITLAPKKTSGKTMEASTPTINTLSTQTIKPTKSAKPTPTPTTKIDNASVAQINALKKAKNYLEFSAFSYQELIEQLEFNKFTHEQAVYGAKSVGLSE